MRSISSIAKAYFKSVGLELKFRTVGRSVRLCVVDLTPSPGVFFEVFQPLNPDEDWSGYLIIMKRGFKSDEPFESGAEHGIPGECGQTDSEAADKLLSRIKRVGWEVVEYSGDPNCGLDEPGKCSYRCDECTLGRKFVRRFSMPEFDSYEELDLMLSTKGY